MILLKYWGDVLLVNEALEREIISKYFGRKSKTYQRKFRKLALRANVMGGDVSSSETMRAILKLRGWNWAGFTLGLLWMSYRKLDMAWFLLFLLIVLTFAEALLPKYSYIFGALTIGVSFSIALRGNTILFAHYLTALQEEKLDMCKPSFFRVFLLFFGGFVLLIGFGAFLLYFTA